MSATLTRSFRALAVRNPRGLAAAAGSSSSSAARRWNSSESSASGSETVVAPSESEGAGAASSAVPDSPAAGQSSSQSPAPGGTGSANTPFTKRSNPPSSTNAFHPAIAHHTIPRPSSFISSLSSTLDSNDLPRHKHINFPDRQFAPPAPSAKPATLGGNEQQRKEAMLAASTGLSVAEIKGLRRYTVKVGRVTQMTKKGKM